jgi:hypothetical protein
MALALIEAKAMSGSDIRAAVESVITTVFGRIETAHELTEPLITEPAELDRLVETVYRLLTDTGWSP